MTEGKFSHLRKQNLFFFKVISMQGSRSRVVRSTNVEPVRHLKKTYFISLFDMVSPPTSDMILLLWGNFVKWQEYLHGAIQHAEFYHSM